MLCIFAVFGAQVFGVVRGFACDCGGRTQIVEASDCHGPHGASCHEDGAWQPDCADDEKNSDDRKAHKPVNDDLLGGNATAPSSVVPAPSVLAVLPELSLFAPAQPAAEREYLSDAYSGPPLSIAVSRMVVRRI